MAIAACILWGSAFPALKVGYELLQLGPQDYWGRLLFAGYRFFLAGILLFATIPYFFKESIVVSKELVKRLFLFGLLNTTLLYSFFYNGLANTTAVKGSILNSTGVFFSVVFAHLVYRDDRLSWRKAIGVVLGFSGIVIANLDPTGLTLSFRFLGEGLVLLAAMIAAIGNIFGKELTSSVHPFLVTAYQMLFGSLALIALGSLGRGSMYLPFNPSSLLLLLYLGFLSAAAFSLWYTVLKYSRLGEVSLYRFIIPVSGSLLAVWILPEEGLSLSLLVALLLVSMGIVIVNYHTVATTNLKEDEG